MKKKTAKRLQLSKETLVHLHGGSGNGMGGEGNSNSDCAPTCISTSPAYCKENTTVQ